MNTIPSKPGDPADQSLAIAIIAAAFTTEPSVRWLYPDPAIYLSAFPRAVQLMGAPAIQAGTADLTEDRRGAAFWVPPGGEADEEALGALIAETVSPDRHEAVFGLLGQFAEYHPKEPVWYLPFIGVDPACQGGGRGSALLAVGLARADAAGLPAYLESGSPRSRALYERHGFTTMGEIRSGDSPPVWPMIRQPRPSP